MHTCSFRSLVVSSLRSHASDDKTCSSPHLGTRPTFRRKHFVRWKCVLAKWAFVTQNTVSSVGVTSPELSAASARFVGAHSARSSTVVNRLYCYSHKISPCHELITISNLTSKMSWFGRSAVPFGVDLMWVESCFGHGERSWRNTRRGLAPYLSLA